jgi:anti-sigma regulatory factor (Ser/Thr protein kinase)
VDNVVTERLELSSDPGSVGMARRFLGRIVRELELPVETVAVAKLAASELVTNAVVHGTPPIAMCVDATITEVTVSVTDASTVQPRADETRLDATGGRGLAIVAAVAGRWGYEPEDSGKRVWFTVTR